ncbi:MAG: helix-turn-helix domain-containing protein, partial [Gemmatimonadota bacterium]
ELRMLRKRIADEKNVPAFVIFGDASLREMAHYLPHDRDAFSAISGVGAAKLEQLADEFLPAIIDYSDKRGLSPRDAPARRRSASRPAARRSSNGRPSLSASLTETKRLFSENFSVEEIASERGFTVNTIFSHLERIARSDPEFDLGPLMPSPDRAETISTALRTHENGFLSPVKEALGDEYSYGEIRMVRLHMERNFENSENGDPRH